jgi:hypothetical protein
LNAPAPRITSRMIAATTRRGTSPSAVRLTP